MNKPTAPREWWLKKFGNWWQETDPSHDAVPVIERFAYLDKCQEVDRLEYALSCVLDHATGGRMSKTNYTKEAMYEQIDAHIERQLDERLEHELMVVAAKQEFLDEETQMRKRYEKALENILREGNLATIYKIIRNAFHGKSDL